MIQPVTTYAIRHSASLASIVDLSAKAEAAMTAHLDEVCAEYGRALIRTEWRAIEPRSAIELNGATEEVTHCHLIGGPPYLMHETTLARVEFVRSYANCNATWSARAGGALRRRPDDAREAAQSLEAWRRPEKDRDSESLHQGVGNVVRRQVAHCAVRAVRGVGGGNQVRCTLHAVHTPEALPSSVAVAAAAANEGERTMHPVLLLVRPENPKRALSAARARRCAKSTCRKPH